MKLSNLQDSKDKDVPRMGVPLLPRGRSSTNFFGNAKAVSLNQAFLSSGSKEFFGEKNVPTSLVKGSKIILSESFELIMALIPKGVILFTTDNQYYPNLTVWMY